MEITSVEVRKTEREDSRMKGKAIVIIDDCFLIRDIRIRERDGNLIIDMPNRKRVDGDYYDIAHPLNKETRKMFEDKIIEKYNEQV